MSDSSGMSYRHPSDLSEGCRSVTCLISQRLAGGRADSQTVALVLPGGGMLGAWQAGLLSEMYRAGLAEVFDLVVGCSAGAINAAYFVAGQSDDCVYAYTDVLSGRRFFNPARIWRMMDIDFLIDDVVSGAVPLDLNALRSASTPSHAVLTELATGDAHLFDAGHDEIFEILRASAAAPVVYGRAPWVGGVRYLDGGLASPFPVREAFELGATCALVVVPHPPGRRWQRQTGLSDAALVGWSYLRSPQAGVMAYRRAPDLFDAGMRLCEDPPDGRLAAVFPSAGPALSNGFTANDRRSVVRSAAEGAASFRRFAEELHPCEHSCDP